MKRQIKFRGIDIENDHAWRFGYLVKKDNECVIISYDKDGNELSYDVDSDTVGQYTGLRDKEGREIYEGDIVEFNETASNVHSSKYIGEVVIHKGKWSVETYKYEHRFFYTLFKDDFANKKTQILGNIHENTGLIKNI